MAGSGKMAENLGFFFLQKGYPVHWLSHSPARLLPLKTKIEQTKKRMQRFFPEKSRSFSASVSTYDAPIPQPDIIIETSVESLAHKQQIFASLAHLTNDQTLLLTNSSSILPHTIHPRCLGAHFFYPVQLTEILEFISSDPDHPLSGQALRFFRDNTLEVIQQDERNAFLINRLLLPLQAACLHALRDGFTPEEIDAASQSSLMGMGQLSLIRSISVDLVATAVRHYQSLPGSLPQPDFPRFLADLALLDHAPSPETPPRTTVSDRDRLQRHLHLIFTDSCRQAVERKLIGAGQLKTVLADIFHAPLDSSFF